MSAITSLAAHITKASREEHHLSHGLSSHGSCIAKQAFSRLFKDEIPDQDQGAMIRGKEFHTFMQRSLPSGMFLDGRWLIIGHEQFILPVVDGERRWSPIDTLVFDRDEGRFEIWDWKLTRVDLKYLHKLDRTYRYQANYYAAKFHEKWGYGGKPPICRVIFANAADWAVYKDFSWEMDPALAKDSEAIITTVHAAQTNLGTYGMVSPAVYRRDFATGLNHWSATKKPYRKDCAYCSFHVKCKMAAGIPDGVDLKEGKIPALGGMLK